ncbi:hypothetical protein Mterra_02754 [Calidithermus terrae]|uniref:Uncharacterized protein n=1 Tax=Calidithermus terrae TaxID=1408545 RepID=A0A399ED05_9DEIN|nr:hypothetical protein [Calidithermus terrae]RIH82215.1 hypothetical protein Mterra_02754 [Calidithermus terrae]
MSLETLWQQSWQEFYEAALQELPGFVQQRLQNPPAVADHDEAMFDIRVTLLTWPIEGLNDYVDALDGWIAQWNLQDPASHEADTSVWPHDIPVPPPEPEGIWEAVLQRATDPGFTGFVAAGVLKLMAMARVAGRYTSQ